MAYGCTYGLPYGTDTCPTVDPTIRGSEPLCKQDTYFLGKGSGVWADLAVDRSDQATDMTVGTNCIHESSTERFDRSGELPRSIDLLVLLDSSSSGTLFAAVGSYFLSIDAGAITIEADDLVYATFTSTLITATPGVFAISWNTEAALQDLDECRSEIQIVRVADGATEIFFANHDAAATTTGPFIFGALETTGTDAFDGTIYLVRFGHRFHTSVETHEDFYALSAEPTTDLALEPELLDAFDQSMGAESEFHGPAMAWASAHHRGMLRRVMSPLVNVHYIDAETMSSTFDSGPLWRYFDAQAIGLMYLYRVPVPLTANRCYVRVFVETTTSGATTPFTLRCYSMTRLPGVSPDILGPGDSPEPTRKAYVGETISRNDASGGEWSELGFLPLQYTRDGFTYLALTISSFSRPSTQTIKIKAWQVIPCQLEVEDGGLGPGGFSP